MHKKTRVPSLIKYGGLVKGYSAHNMRARVILKAGAIMKGVIFDFCGFSCSFVNSLIASARGTGSPKKEGLLGPLRIWK